MEIRLIFLKEIIVVISLKDQPNSFFIKHLMFEKKKSRRRFFLPKASLISILQKSSSDGEPILAQTDRLSQKAGASLARSRNRANSRTFAELPAAGRVRFCDLQQ